MKNQFKSDHVGLLVSVRNAEEAVFALQGGADLIDVKEPNRGALGAANLKTIAEVVQSVSGAVPVSAAMGELVDFEASSAREFPAGVSFAKFGLAGCATLSSWPQLWEKALAAIPSTVTPVAVIYADYQRAEAPEPRQVLRGARDLACGAVLIDTFDKQQGDLFHSLSESDLPQLLSEIHEHDFVSVLAGSLSEATLARAVALGPNYLAVRGAACDGNRQGTISLQRVQRLKALLPKAPVLKSLS